MQFAAAYITALIVFLLIDAAWLSTMANALYRPVLGDIVLPSLRVCPAIAFYAMFPIGFVAFAAMPALKSSAVGAAVIYGLLFGAIAYGTLRPHQLCDAAELEPADHRHRYRVRRLGLGHRRLGGDARRTGGGLVDVSKRQGVGRSRQWLTPHSSPLLWPNRPPVACRNRRQRRCQSAASAP
jgi:uncharacterized membrane protein